MVLDISDEQFRDILKDEQFHLPIRWNGTNFSSELRDLFDEYIKKIYSNKSESTNNIEFIQMDLLKIDRLCECLVRTVDDYLDGSPAKAYRCFKHVMETLSENPLKIYQKSVFEQVGNGELNLFRVVGVDDNKPYKRNRVFHTPYNLRSKVSTSRYSIAGYPSLYLGTSLDLCCEEIHLNPHKQFALAARLS